MIHKLFAIAGRMYRSALPVRSTEYRAWVASWPCIACGTEVRRRDPMHTGPHGIAQKASDLECVPGCRRCHEQLHRLGPVRFQLLHDISFPDAVEALQKMYVQRFGRLPGEERRAA